MFTGLVQSVGTIAGIEARPQSKRLRIAAALREDDRILGASVAVSGVCLTVVDATAELFEVDAAFETLARTTLGDLRVGDRVNLEPALRIGDALGGHLVSGHVDGVGRLRSRSARGDAILMWFDVPTELRRYVAEKGSICVDGVSLTVNAIDGAGFSGGLIPHTLSVTTLGDRRPGAAAEVFAALVLLRRSIGGDRRRCRPTYGSTGLVVGAWAGSLSPTPRH